MTDLVIDGLGAEVVKIRDLPGRDDDDHAQTRPSFFIPRCLSGILTSNPVDEVPRDLTKAELEAAIAAQNTLLVEPDALSPAVLKFRPRAMPDDPTAAFCCIAATYEIADEAYQILIGLIAPGHEPGRRLDPNEQIVTGVVYAEVL